MVYVLIILIKIIHPGSSTFSKNEFNKVRKCNYFDVEINYSRNDFVHSFVKVSILRYCAFLRKILQEKRKANLLIPQVSKFNKESCFACKLHKVLQEKLINNRRYNSYKLTPRLSYRR